jgi:anti-anti-sigma regulatory factor
VITETAAVASADVAEIFAGDYLNKLSGEKIEYECRRRLDDGYRKVVVNFSRTEIVNSIGISILLGVIDIVAKSGGEVVFSDVNEHTIELFDMLGVTKHVSIQ